MLQEEYEDQPQILRAVLGKDCPTLYIAAKRLRTWIEEERISFAKYPNKFELEQEMVSCALDEVDWHVLTYRITRALKVPVSEVSDSFICPKCKTLICQMCILCPNPSCGNAHRIDCLSENTVYPLGPLLFDFTDRKLVVRIGNYEMPISQQEYKRFYTWLDIRKDG